MPRLLTALLPLALFTVATTVASAAPWRVQERVNRTERLSNTLRNGFEREIRDYGWAKLRAGTEAKLRVRRLDESMETLRREASDKHPLRGRDTVVAVVSRARAVDAIFRAHREFSSTERLRWRRLKTEINALARIYDVRSRVG